MKFVRVEAAERIVEGVRVATDNVSGTTWLIVCSLPVEASDVDQILCKPINLVMFKTSAVSLIVELADVPVAVVTKLEQALFNRPTGSKATTQANCDGVLKFFRQNGIQTELEHPSETIVAFGCLRLRPPYGLDDVTCDNKVVLVRFLELYTQQMHSFVT